MTCSECRVEKICTVKREIRNAGITANIVYCPYYSEDAVVTMKAKNNGPYPVANARTMDKQRPMEEVLDVAAKIREISESEQSEKENTEKYLCDVCHTEEATNICFKCGKSICPDCMVVDAKTHLDYCEDCYDNLPTSRLKM